MGRNLQAKCRVCRRAGRKLLLKGDRCATQKCAIIRRKYPPGFHGHNGYPQLSEYGQLLREKQNMKFFYGLMEAQFKNYFHKAKEQKQNVEIFFLSSLEKRLDNVLTRAGFFTSRKRARQIVNHGHVYVNGHRVSIPSYQVKIGDQITFKTSQAVMAEIQNSVSLAKGSLVTPLWLTTDYGNLTIQIVKDLGEADLPKEFNLQSIVEFYSR
jgi:small subunit ribosomal protein S4